MFVKERSLVIVDFAISPLFEVPRSMSLTNNIDEETRKWDLRTYQYWNSLLQGKEGKVCGIPGSEGRGEDDLREMAFARTKAIGLGFKESRNYWGKVRSFTF